MMTLMAVLIDGRPVELKGADLNEVLSAARRHLEPAGRVVVEVALDGQPLSAQSIENQRQASITGSELSLTTAEPHTIAVQVLQEVRQGLAAVRLDQQTAAELLQQDEQTEALQRLATVIETWQQAQQGVIQSLKLAQIDVNTVKTGEQAPTDLLDRLADGLRSLRDQLAARDTVAVADALIYEWPELLDQWDSLVAAVIDAVERRSIQRGKAQP